MDNLPTATNPRSCPVCCAPLQQGQDRCPNCGATHNKRHTCPFCNVVAQADTHTVLRLACPACGAPRVPVGNGLQTSPKAIAALTTARSAKSSLSVWRIATGLCIAFGLFAFILLALVMLVTQSVLIPMLVGCLVCAMPILFAALAMWKVSQRKKELTRAIDEAWVDSASQLATVAGSIRTQDLMQSMSIKESEARSLLAKLGASNGMSTSINDDGELVVYAHSNLRVAPVTSWDAGKLDVGSQGSVRTADAGSTASANVADSAYSEALEELMQEQAASRMKSM